MRARKIGSGLTFLRHQSQAKDGDPVIASLFDRLPLRLFEDFSIDRDEPDQAQSVGRKHDRGGIDCITKDGVWSGTKTFQSVRSRGASGELD